MGKPRIPVDLIVAKLAEDAEKARVRAQKASDVLLQELDTEIAPTPDAIRDPLEIPEGIRSEDRPMA